MIDISKIDYSVLDRPEILMYLFHPRPEFGGSVSVSTHKDMMIPVEAKIAIGARFHLSEQSACNILFFHGNGEIVADYDELGQMMNQSGINFFAVDYRGYGRSTGQPTVTAMMRDCHVVFDYVKKWLNKNDYPGPLVLMGRSLGSASVLELAMHYADGIDGLIVESGFAYAGPLLALLGIAVGEIGFEEATGFRNIDKIHTFDKPTLIIHAERDHIIPFTDGEALFESCSATDKTLLKILGANHNDIFMQGFKDYMAAVTKLAVSLASSSG
jgi:alpha-beta hydrolase superfamily lysophospholipase